MGGGSGAAPLEDDEGEGADDGDEVEGEVHEVADYGGGGELFEGAVEDWVGG